MKLTARDVSYSADCAQERYHIELSLQQIDTDMELTLQQHDTSFVIHSNLGVQESDTR